jgi:hypothetical protein
LFGVSINNATYKSRADYDLSGSISSSDYSAYVPAWRLACACPSDYNVSGTTTVQDLFDFIGDFMVGNAIADFNGDGTVAFQDLADFLMAFFAPAC